MTTTHQRNPRKTTLAKATEMAAEADRMERRAEYAEAWRVAYERTEAAAERLRLAHEGLPLGSDRMIFAQNTDRAESALTDAFFILIQTLYTKHADSLFEAMRRAGYRVEYIGHGKED